MNQQQEGKPAYELGIDEAGRGPVLGPMVYGAAWWLISDSADIQKKYKFDDSKKLQEAKRESLYASMKADQRIHSNPHPIMPETLSAKMLSLPAISLNVISKNAAKLLIQQALDQGFNISKVYVDTVGDAKKYEMELSMVFKTIDFKVASKADSTYPVVSAASICAKVNRDHILKDWKFKEQGNARGGLFVEPFSRVFGCGYPSDQLTRQWLDDSLDPIFGFPSIVRFSWKTIAKPTEGTPMGDTVWPDVIEAERALKEQNRKKTQKIEEKDRCIDEFTDREPTKRCLAAQKVMAKSLGFS